MKKFILLLIMTIVANNAMADYEYTFTNQRLDRLTVNQLAVYLEIDDGIGAIGAVSGAPRPDCDVPLEKTHAFFDEIYSMLLAAKLADEKLNIMVEVFISYPIGGGSPVDVCRVKSAELAN